MAKQTNNEIVLWSENQNTAAMDEEASRASFIDSTESLLFPILTHFWLFTLETPIVRIRFLFSTVTHAISYANKRHLRQDKGFDVFG